MSLLRVAWRILKAGMQGLPKIWLYRSQSLAFLPHLYSPISILGKKHKVLCGCVISILWWTGLAMSNHRPMWGHREFCWSFPNRSVLRAVLSASYFLGGGLCLLDFFAKCGQYIFTAISSKGLCSLELPESWDSWSCGICHSFGGDFCITALRPSCFCCPLKISFNVIMG